VGYDEIEIFKISNIFMKPILQIAAFVTIIIFVSVTLVSVHKVFRDQLILTPQIAKECLTNSSLPCDNSKSSIDIPFIPDQKLDDQQRFLATIAKKIPTIPQDDTFEYTLLRSYGTVFINQESGINLPQKVILDNELETKSFQKTMSIALVDGTQECYLQKTAAAARAGQSHGSEASGSSSFHLQLPGRHHAHGRDWPRRRPEQYRHDHR
jgi:hypothetical protein